MAKLWQFRQGHPKPAFSEKVQRGDQGKFFKNRPKSSPRLKGPKALLPKWHYPLISMQLNCKDWRKLWRKKNSKSARKAKLWQFLKGHPKSAFSKKVQGKLSKKRTKAFKKEDKKQPSLKRPKSTLAKMALSSNQYALIVQRLENILTQNAALKVLEWPSYGNFCKVTQNPHFRKSAKGGPREIFKKSPKKKFSFERPKSTLAPMALSSNFNALKVQRLEKILAQTAAPKKPEQPSYNNFCKVTQTRIF